jgi:Ala-tRNA(Pro) deacylase
MSIPIQISKYLDSQGISYQLFSHERAYTAQGTAQAQHLSGKRLAKVVIVSSDRHRLIMAVVPANSHVDVDKLGKLVNASWIRLATEAEFKDAFPDCELGAMPPLGNIYHIEVWIDEVFRTYPTICFNAGTHSEIIRMSSYDFMRLVQPQEGSFSVLMH